MDIIPNKKSKLLYQKGDQEMKGIIDLRCFSDEKKNKREKITKRNVGRKKTVLEITKRKDREKRPAKQAAYSKKSISTSKQLRPSTKKRKKAKPYSPAKCAVKPNLIPEIKLAKPKFKFSLLWQKSFVSFVVTIVFVSLTVFSLSFIQKGVEEKGRILGASTEAYDYLKQAEQSVSSQNFQNSANDFDSARLNFSKTKTAIENFGLGVTGTISNLPINTPISQLLFP